MNAIIPLHIQDSVVEYFTIDAPLRQFNQILDIAQRPCNSELFVIEQNPLSPDRDNLILYNDQTDITLLSGYTEEGAELHLQSSVSDELFDGVVGVSDYSGGSSLIYYLEILPYPDSLTSWVIGLRIDRSAIEAPFFRRDTVVVTGGLFALIMSLLFAQLGASRIAAPVKKLTDNLVSYTHNRMTLPAQNNGPDELREAGAAFDKMVDNLEAAELKRDRA